MNLASTPEAIFTQSPRVRSLLLVPMQPTPNGRLHIGHGSGPYLRADVIARAYRREGHDAQIVTGSDAYENWVELAAAAASSPVEELCRTFDRGIQEDLAKLGVRINAWIDPTSEPRKSRYFAIHDILLGELRKSDCVVLEEERIPFNAKGRAVIGPWLVGNCPYCNAECGGNTCVSCGQHFQPEEIRNPASRVDEGDLRWETRLNLFLRPRDLSEVGKAIQRSVPENLRSPAEVYLREKFGRIRLSQVGGWGIPSASAPPGCVLSNTYYGYSLYCGEVYAKKNNLQRNAFHKQSNIVTVALFGTDNSIAGSVAPSCIASCAETVRGFDHTIINHMLYFEEHKCSTSKNHGIWLGEAADEGGLTADEIRFALARVPLDMGIGSVDSRLINDAISVWRNGALVRIAMARDHSGSEWSGPTLNKLRAAAVAQNSSLSLASFRLDRAHSVFENWLLDTSIDLTDSATAATWLLGVAYLGEPLVPALSALSRDVLGLNGISWSDAITSGPSPHPEIFLPQRERAPSVDRLVRRQKRFDK